MAVYMQIEVVPAAGYLRPNQSLLHCHNVPADYACVMLTAANTEVKAPFVLGDPKNK